MRRGATLAGAVGVLMAAPVVLAQSASTTRTVERGLSITSFDSVLVAAPVDLRIIPGARISGQVTGPVAGVDALDVSVDNGRLTIRRRGGAPTPTWTTGPRRGGTAPVVITITAGPIRQLGIDGAGSASVARMAGQTMTITLAGAGSASVAEAVGDKLTIIQTGSGQLSVGGRVGDAVIEQLGTGAVMGEALVTERLTAAASGAGLITVTASDTARIDARGPGEITVLGKAKCTVRQSGTGAVTCG